MKVVILAAGRGKRFGAITRTTPKCLLPVAGKPILHHLLGQLPESTSEIIVVIGHLGEEIVRALGHDSRGRRIRYCVMAPLIGTAGALWSARSFLSGHFLVLNGDDIIAEADLQNLVTHSWAWGVQERPNSKAGDWT